MKKKKLSASPLRKSCVRPCRISLQLGARLDYLSRGGDVCDIDSRDVAAATQVVGAALPSARGGNLDCWWEIATRKTGRNTAGSDTRHCRPVDPLSLRRSASAVRDGRAWPSVRGAGPAGVLHQPLQRPVRHLRHPLLQRAAKLPGGTAGGLRLPRAGLGEQLATWH